MRNSFVYHEFQLTKKEFRLKFFVKIFIVYCQELGTKNQRPKKEEEGGGGNRWIEKVKGEKLENI